MKRNICQRNCHIMNEVQEINPKKIHMTKYYLLAYPRKCKLSSN